MLAPRTLRGTAETVVLALGAGAVCVARVHLGYHSIPQVLAGGALGAALGAALAARIKAARAGKVGKRRKRG